MENTFNTRTRITVGDHSYTAYSLRLFQENGHGDVSRLPKSLKVLLENLLRHEDGTTVHASHVMAMVKWLADRRGGHEIAYRPARVLMQDFTGVPAVVDLAAMRDALAASGKSADNINPFLPVDLVIDHSVVVDDFGSADAYRRNVEKEFQRNRERYQFLKWGQSSFANFRVVPPGTGICHQVNLEYLAKTVWTSDCNGECVAYPDTLVGTDSHTTMVNGLGVLGWGVGGIEAEAAMLGQPISLLIPEVVGVRLTGELAAGVTATDLVLCVVEMLRQHGVVGKFVEYFGPGLAALPLADRATLANMAPEYGATCGFFPVDQETLAYLSLTGRDDQQVALVEAYTKEQGLWVDASSEDPLFTEILELDMATVQPSVAGPTRPQDRVALTAVPRALDTLLRESGRDALLVSNSSVAVSDRPVQHGDVVIAAITSCTNTSNPAVMIAAGLLAQKAVAQGLHCKPWVKTSLAPGSRVVTGYLEKAGLDKSLDALGFTLAGYGCTTCIGNSGPLPESVAQDIDQNDLLVCAVLSGNRNFEGRVHPQVKGNWLASPPLVVAYALAGTMAIDWQTQPLGTGADGGKVYLKDLWPTSAEINNELRHVTGSLFRREYSSVFNGGDAWRQLTAFKSATYAWESGSTYIRRPLFFDPPGSEDAVTRDVTEARILVLLGDSVTTDHISPAGVIKPESPAGRYLQEAGVDVAAFNSYGSRRGNHEVMVRGTFANIRLRNEIVPGIEGGYTRNFLSGEQVSIFDAAAAYAEEKIPLVVVAGREYGTGSSRDWAAKGTRLLGVRAVIAESFERIHRSNLLGMGVLPLQFDQGVSRKTLGLSGRETVSIKGIASGLQPGSKLKVTFTCPEGGAAVTEAVCRIDTAEELQYFLAGGILQYVLSVVS